MLNIIGLNTANYSNCVSWNNITGHVTTVGFNGGPSPYNTYDQNGNVWEWLETISVRDNTVYRTFAGGSYKDSELALRSSYIHDRYYPGATEPNNDVTIYPFVGFRVASYVNPLDLQFFVPVLDANNIANNNSIGSVSYNYQISQYQVLISDYVTFLNTVDPNGTLAQTTDTLNSLGEPITDSKNILYHYLMNSDSRGGIIRNVSADIGNKYAMKLNMFGKPVNFVNWYMAAAYCNWLHNRVDDPDTVEYMTGAYDLNSSSPDNAQRNNNARYFLLTLDEWYKAAYYKGGNSGDLDAGYWLYATRSNETPTCPYIDSSGIGPWKYTLDHVNIRLNDLTPRDNYTVNFSIKENNMYDASLDKYEYSFMASKTTQNVVVGLTKNLLINNLTIVATVTNISSNVIENILYVPMSCPNSSCLLDSGLSTVTPPEVSPPDAPPPAVSATLNAANFNKNANWNGTTIGNVTTVGSNGGSSYYGTFDQSGNVYQWNDLNGAAGLFRGLRGGSWYSIPSLLSSSLGRLPYYSSFEDYSIGFRLASSFSTPNPLNLPYFINIADENNIDDDTGFGGVSYPYQINQYLVTNYEYVAFLNAIARIIDTYTLYNSSMNDQPHGGITRNGISGSYTYTVKPNMGNKPVVYINWFDCARYCNWLHNNKPIGGQNNSTTEDGAYTLHTNGILSAEAVQKNSGARYHIPTENEWYKAAYYSPNKNGSGLPGYYKYATQSDIDPRPTLANSVGDGLANISNYSTSITLGLFSQWRIRNLTTNTTFLSDSITNGVISNLPLDYGPNNTSLAQSVQLQTYLVSSNTWISQESWISRLGNPNNIFRPWNWNLVGGV